MSDYILRDVAIIEFMDNDIDHIQAPNGKEAVQILSDIPSADVVSVVRCRDCKYVRKFRSEESAKKFGQVYECAKYIISCPNPDDFCSYGERKERKHD